MADNLNITSGSGVVVATDDISNVHYQRIKLVDGNLESTNATGVATNPLIVSVSNSNNIVSVSNTSATISVLNTLSVVSVLNTLSVVSILNTSSTISVLNTVQIVAVSNTSATVSVLNTSSTISVLNTRTSVTVSGGVTLLSSIPLNIDGTVLVSGGVTLLSVGTVLVSGAVTSLVSGGVTLLSSVPLTITGTTLISGGVTLLSSSVITAKRDVIGYSGTWIYAALTSNNMTVVWTPAAGKRFNITDLTINTVSAATIYVTQDTSSALTIMRLSLMDRGGWVSNLQTPITASQTNHALVVQSTNTGSNGYVSVTGYES